MRSKNPELMEKIRTFAENYVLENGICPSTTQVGEAFGISRGTAYKYMAAMDGAGGVSYRGGVFESGATRLRKGGTARAALVGSIPCGTPEEEPEEVEAYLNLPTAIFGEGDFYILRASGDSMIKAGIETGDLVVIEKTSQAREGDIVVALVGNENTLKRYFVDRERGCVVLHPENDAMEDICVRSCVIQGVARNVIKVL